MGIKMRITNTAITNMFLVLGRLHNYKEISIMCNHLKTGFKINFSIVIPEKNGVLNAAGVRESCNSPPRSESRAGPCWGTRKIRF